MKMPAHLSRADNHAAACLHRQSLTQAAIAADAGAAPRLAPRLDDYRAGREHAVDDQSSAAGKGSAGERVGVCQREPAGAGLEKLRTARNSATTDEREVAGSMNSDVAGRDRARKRDGRVGRGTQIKQCRASAGEIGDEVVGPDAIEQPVAGGVPGVAAAAAAPGKLRGGDGRQRRRVHVLAEKEAGMGRLVIRGVLPGDRAAILRILHQRVKTVGRNDCGRVNAEVQIVGCAERLPRASRPGGRR